MPVRWRSPHWLDSLRAARCSCQRAAGAFIGMPLMTTIAMAMRCATGRSSRVHGHAVLGSLFAQSRCAEHEADDDCRTGADEDRELRGIEHRTRWEGEL